MSASDGLRRRVERQAQELAGRLKAWLPRGVGFVLLVFDQPDGVTRATDEPGWLSYVSSVKRDGGAALVDGLFARWRAWPGKPRPTDADLDDVAKALLLEAQLGLADLGPDRERALGLMRELAGAAAKLGASADLARHLAAHRGSGPS